MKKQKKTAHGHLKWDQNELIDEKKRVQKISWDCPFKGEAQTNLRREKILPSTV